MALGKLLYVGQTFGPLLYIGHTLGSLRYIGRTLGPLLYTRQNTSSGLRVGRRGQTTEENQMMPEIRTAKARKRPNCPACGYGVEGLWCTCICFSPFFFF